MSGRGVGELQGAGLEWGQRIHFTPWKPLVRMTSANNPIPAAQVPFRVRIPDARLQTKLSFLCSPSPAAPTPFDVTFGGQFSTNLWIAAFDEGLDGQQIPITNLVGTNSVPQIIPEDVGLCGFSSEFETSADMLAGYFQIAALGSGVLTLSPKVTWSVRARWQPKSGALLCESEWLQIVSLCSLDVGPSLPTIGPNT